MARVVGGQLQELVQVVAGGRPHQAGQGVRRRPHGGVQGEGIPRAVRARVGRDEMLPQMQPQLPEEVANQVAVTRQQMARVVLVQSQANGRTEQAQNFLSQIFETKKSKENGKET